MSDQVGEFDLNALYASLDKKRESLSMTWSDVARAISTQRTGPQTIGVSASTITGMRSRRSVEADGVPDGWGQTLFLVSPCRKNQKQSLIPDPPDEVRRGVGTAHRRGRKRFRAGRSR